MPNRASRAVTKIRPLQAIKVRSAAIPEKKANLDAELDLPSLIISFST
jgi:hypothetical protein